MIASCSVSFGFLGFICFFIRLIKRNCLTALFILVIFGLMGSRFSQSHPLDLSHLSLEELMNLEFVTASRNPQPLAETAAAVYVISNEAIKHSGVTSIADALRMAPGVQVAQISSHTWAVSIRGFNDRFSNKLLVLMDGRTLYNPLHSGVIWEVQDMVLEDIDRIEIIRGPGAAMWGANAVNGVINIITKNSSDTLGSLLTVAGGTSERFHGQARFGGRAGERTTYRLYGKYLERAEGENITFMEGEDSWNMGQGGFRLDHAFSAQSHLSLQGDLYQARLEDMNISAASPLFIAMPVESVWDMKGHHLLGAWRYTMADNSNLQAQFYYDTTTTDSIFGNEERETYDFDFQHIFSLTDNQNITWGIGFRQSADDIEGTYQVNVVHDPTRRDILYSAFLQDEIALFSSRLKLIIGSKFEHNDYTGVEIQPSVRGSWQPADNHSLWAAVSRAVRTPSRYEHDGILRSPLLQDPENGSIIARIWQSSTDFDSEVLVAYETGYRHIVNEKLSFDLALFYNDYEEIGTMEAEQPTLMTTPFGDLLLQPYVIDNAISGFTWGGELVANILPADWWRLQGVYSYLQMQLENESENASTSAEDINNTSPGSQLSLRSHMTFPHNLSLDLWLRYVGALSSENVESYWDGDIRVAWEPVEHFELSLVGRNLFRESHKEMEQHSYSSLSTEVKRSLYLKLSWRF